jgi:hypothetical protein
MKKFVLTTARALVGAAILAATSVVSSANAYSLNGVVQTGGTGSSQPIANVNVTLFEATDAQPTVLGQATTNTSGQFTITSPENTSSSIFYMSADIGGGVEFVAVLGPNLPVSVTINELTTVAASYSMAQFLETGVISGNSFGLQLAAGMNDNIVAVATGDSSAVLLNSPNADQTNSLRSTRSLANLLAACVQNRRVTRDFFHLTKPARGGVPKNTAEALANLARGPGQNVEPIYALTLLQDLYDPPVTSVPDAWTVTVKVNDTGNDDFLFGGPGNLAFDSRGYAWILNNVVQGTPNSCRFNVVLKPNGQPADGSNGTPTSPLMGGGILGGGFGVTIDRLGSVWLGNFGWGQCSDCDPTPHPPGNGSVSQFDLSGTAISGPEGYYDGTLMVQGMASDAAGNIWISSFGNDSVYVFRHGDHHRSVGYPQYRGSGPFDVAVASTGSVWVSNSGGLDGHHPSSVARYDLVNGVLTRRFIRRVGNNLRGIAVDSRGNAWVGSLNDNKVYGFHSNGIPIGSFSDGGMDSPWDVTVDGDDNLWIVNFGPLQPGNNFTVGRLTKLAGADPATRPPGKHLGDPISPPTGYTVPSEGSPVLLHNGEPLYGPGTCSYSPMMRQTAAVIDQAGNIWTINNWKPDFDIDSIGMNPGGDGIIIFVGLAPPPHQTP